MILGANQPYFMPYLGYWQLINAVDVFGIADDYNFIKGGWIQRNRILNSGSVKYFGVELNKASQNKLISEIELKDLNVEEKLRQLTFSYKKAPQFDTIMPMMERILTNKEKNLAIFLTDSLTEVCKYLGITTEFFYVSSLHHNRDELKGKYRIYDMCEKKGADTYYNAVGGQQLYSYEEFKEKGIKLGFLEMDEIEYKQVTEPFTSGLSIIDVMMNNSKEEVQRLLNCYHIITENEVNVQPNK